MGFQTSAYHFYGVHIPKDQWTHAWASGEEKLLSQVLRAVSDLAPDIRTIAAGPYDQDMLFLAVKRPGHTAEVELGEFRLVTHDQASDLGWDRQLLTVVKTVGYTKTGRPGWITVPNVS